MIDDREANFESTERQNDGKVHVHVSHWIDNTNPEGPMLFRVEMWPLPKETGAKITAAMAKLAMEMLNAEGLGTEGDWAEESSDVSVDEALEAIKHAGANRNVH